MHTQYGLVIGGLLYLAIRPSRKTDMSLSPSADEGPDRRPDLPAWHEDGEILVKYIRTLSMAPLEELGS